MKQYDHVSHGKVCLGKGRVKRPLKMLPLSNYFLSTSAISSPPVVAWERPMDYGMLGNDSVGDCTIAAALHMQMVWAGVARNAEVPTFNTEQALSLYSAITGYNPADPNTDQGAVETDVLNYWQNTGMVGNKVAGYVAVDVTNQAMVKAATYLFGGVYIGIQVPSYIMQVEAGGSWSQHPSDDASIEGGHAIPICGYGRNGYRIISWGTTYTFNPQFFSDYCEEAYAVVNPLWMKASGVSPTGLDLNGLLADLQEV